MKKLASIPLLPLLIGVIAGILGQRYAPGWIFPSAALLLSGVAIIVRRLEWASAGFAIMVGWLAGEFNDPYQFATPPDDKTVFSGIVTSSSLESEKQTLIIEVGHRIVDKTAYPVSKFRVRATLPFFEPHIQAGDEVTFSGTFSLPYIDTDLPLENDLKAVYYNQGISLIAYVPINRIKVTGRSLNPIYFLLRLNEYIEGKIYASGLNETTAEFLAAILVGDSSDINPERRNLYAVAGVAHVLALSGAHVAVIVMIISFLMIPVAFFINRKLRWWLVIAGIWIFALITGASASVVRSSIMASVVILSIIFDRPRSSLNSLCLAAIIILLFAPHSLYRAGFQFSFMATLSIILFSDRLNPAGRSSHKSHWFLGLFAVTVAATLGTMPLMAYHFHQLPVYFIISNIAMALFMPVMMIGGVMMLFLSLIGMAPAWLIWSLNFTGDCLESLVEWVASLPNSYVSGIFIPGWLLAPVYLALICLFLSILYRDKRWGAASISCFSIAVLSHFIALPSYPFNELYIVRDKHSFNMIIRSADTLKVLSNDLYINREADSINITTRYRDYIASRGVNQIELYFKDFSESGQIDSLGRIAFLDVTFRFAGNDEKSTIPLPSTYCIADKRFKGDIVELSRICAADTIILSADMNALRRKRYAAELTAARRPFRDVASSSFSLSK